MRGEHDQPEELPGEGLPQSARQAMDHLAETNRVLIGSRMISTKEKLAPEQVKEVVSDFKKFIAENKISAAQAARGCGYSGAVLSAWAAGTYTGDVSTVTSAVNVWMEREARRQLSRRPKDYVKTWIAEHIRTCIYLADKRTMMAALVVPAGSGKTKVLKILNAEMRGIYVSCHSGMTVRELYLAIATELGWRATYGTCAAVRKFIIGALADSHRIIFLDEAHQLKERIGCIRSIHDDARVPIIMAGTDEILQFVNDRAHGRGQFSRRCIRYNALDHANNAESPDGTALGRDLFTMEEIQEFFAMKKIRLDRDAIKLVWALACLPSHGTLGLVENIIETALDLEPDATVITRDQVIEALHMLVGGEAAYLQKLANRHQNMNRSAPALAKAG